MVKDQCIVLRKEGKSYREIAGKLAVPLSTVHLWTKNVYLTEEQKDRLIEKSISSLQNGRERAQRIKSKIYREKTRREILTGRKLIKKISTKKELLLIGAALYWAEGFKKDSALGLANSDPDMIIFFLFWLIRILNIPRENIRLRVGINERFRNKTRIIEEYWSKITGIPLDQFQKTFYQKSTESRIYPNAENYHGVLRIRTIGQSEKYRIILGMISSLKNLSHRLDNTG